MDIDSNCPYLLPVFGETTSHLTSKLNVMDGRMDGRTDGWMDGRTDGGFPPPPGFFIFFMLEIAWNTKKTWNI